MTTLVPSQSLAQPSQGGEDPGFVAPLRRSGTAITEEAEAWRAIGFHSPDAIAGPAARVCRVSGNMDGLRAHQLRLVKRALDAGAGVLRVAAYQSFLGDDGNDFTGLDQMVRLARDAGLRLLVVLDAHDDPCASSSNLPKPASWYTGGYFERQGDQAASFVGHANRLARRYAGEPTVMGYQLVLGAPVGRDGRALGRLHANVGRVLAVLAPLQLRVSGAALDCRQGDGGLESWARAHATPGIDLVEAVDLSGDTAQLPDCLARSLAAADALGLPAMVAGGVPTGGAGAGERAQLIADKMGVAAALGVPLYVIWSLGSRQPEVARFDIDVHPPLVPMLRHMGLDRFAAVPGCRPTGPCPDRAMSAPEPILVR